MPQTFVRITLEKPWVGRPDGLLPLIIIGDRDVPQRFADADVPGGMPGPSAAESHIRDIPGVATNGHIPRPVGQTVYVFDCTDPQQNDYIVPDYVAKHWFGHWEWPETQPANANMHPLETKGQELQRVVMQWGGWRYPKMDKPVQMLGQLDMRPVSPPPIPHVAVRVLDRKNHVATVNGKEWVFRPWNYFHFELMCQNILSPLEQLQPLQQLTPPIATIPNGDFQKAIDEAVAAALARQSKERTAKTRAARKGAAA
jgi:hypothetical protein